MIHSERAGAFWLVDLGSSNETFLNKRRVHEPSSTAETVTESQSAVIHSHSVNRRDPSAYAKHRGGVDVSTTDRRDPCWLLVADIKNFTSLTRELLSAKLANAGRFVAGRLQRHH